MKQLNKAFYIISAELSTLSDKENTDRTTQLETFLKESGLLFKQVIGCYKGRKETSFMVVNDENAPIFVSTLLITYGRAFNQESILFVNEHRQARLEFIEFNGDSVPIGKWQDSNIKEVKNLDAWTFCPQLEQYFKVA